MNYYTMENGRERHTGGYRLYVMKRGEGGRQTYREYLILKKAKERKEESREENTNRGLPEKCSNRR